MLMKKGIFSCMLLGMISWTHAADITGTWRTVDDKTGYVRAHIQIEKLKDDTYVGKIIKDFPAPGETALTQCRNCPAPFTNKPIIGLTILQKLKADPNNPNNLFYGNKSQIHESMEYYPKEWTGRKIDSFHWRSFIIACFENLEMV